MKPLARRSKYRRGSESTPPIIARRSGAAMLEQGGKRNAGQWRVGERALGPVEPPRVSFRRDTMNRSRPIPGGAPCVHL